MRELILRVGEMFNPRRILMERSNIFKSNSLLRNTLNLFQLLEYLKVPLNLTEILSKKIRVIANNLCRKTTLCYNKLSHKRRLILPTLLLSLEERLRERSDEVVTLSNILKDCLIVPCPLIITVIGSAGGLAEEIKEPGVSDIYLLIKLKIAMEVEESILVRLLSDYIIAYLRVVIKDLKKLIQSINGSHWTLRIGEEEGLRIESKPLRLEELVKFLLPLREKLVISLLNMNVLVALHFCIWMRIEDGVQDVFR